MVLRDGRLVQAEESRRIVVEDRPPLRIGQPGDLPYARQDRRDRQVVGAEHDAVAETGIDQSATRRAMRALARKGFLEYMRGLFDESDGTLVGSGYGLTPVGKSRAEALPK